jgi:hypothetical protein
MTFFNLNLRALLLTAPDTFVSVFKMDYASTLQKIDRNTYAFLAKKINV